MCYQTSAPTLGFVTVIKVSHTLHCVTKGADVTKIIVARENILCTSLGIHLFKFTFKTQPTDDTTSNPTNSAHRTTRQRRTHLTGRDIARVLALKKITHEVVIGEQVALQQDRVDEGLQRHLVSFGFPLTKTKQRGESKFEPNSTHTSTSFIEVQQSAVKSTQMRVSLGYKLYRAEHKTVQT